MRVLQPPKYLPNVLEAINNLKEQSGSHTYRIINQVESALHRHKRDVRPRNISMQVIRALRHGVENGIVCERAGRFRLARFRGGGRPAKRAPKKRGRPEKSPNDCAKCRRRQKMLAKKNREKRRREERRKYSSSPSESASHISHTDVSTDYDYMSRSKSKSLDTEPPKNDKRRRQGDRQEKRQCKRGPKKRKKTTYRKYQAEESSFDDDDDRDSDRESGERGGSKRKKIKRSDNKKPVRAYRPEKPEYTIDPNVLNVTTPKEYRSDLNHIGEISDNGEEEEMPDKPLIDPNEGELQPNLECGNPECLCKLNVKPPDPDIPSNPQL